MGTEWTRVVPEKIAAMGYKESKNWVNATKHMRADNRWLDHFTNLALTSFRWRNLPTSIPSRYLEWLLLTSTYGGAVGITSIDGDLVAGYATPKGKVRYNNEPDGVMISLPAGNTVEGVNDRDCVVGYDNYNRTSQLPFITEMSERIAEIDHIIDVNVNAQRTPFVMLSPEESRRDAVNFYSKVTGSQPIIYGSKELLENVKPEILSSVAPYVSDKLKNLQQSLICDILTKLGIDNINYEKPERLLSAEAESNNSEVRLERRSRLFSRIEFRDKINGMFELNVEVSYNG